MAEYGLLTEVVIEPRTTELAADAAVGATELEVVDAGDYDPDNGGTLILGGVQLDYTGVVWGATEDDTDMIELAVPLAVAADSGDPVQSVSGGLGEEDWYAHVDMGGGGDVVAVPIRFDQRQSWPEGTYDPPVRVSISEDLSSIEDAPGRPGSVGSRVEAWNADEWAAAGDDTDSPGTLTYLPKPYSLTVEQNGLRLRNSEFTVVGQVVTPLAAETTIRADDVFTAYYDRDPGGEVVGVGSNTDRLTLTVRDISYTSDGSAGNPGLPALTEVGDLVIIAAMQGSLLSTSDTRFTKVTPGGSFGALYVGIATDLSPVVFTGTVQKMVMASFEGGASVLNADTQNDTPYPASVPNLNSVAGSAAVAAVWQQTSVVAGAAPSVAAPFTGVVLSSGTTNYHSMLSIYCWQDNSATSTPAAACAFSGAVDSAQATVVSLGAL